MRVRFQPVIDVRETNERTQPKHAVKDGLPERIFQEESTFPISYLSPEGIFQAEGFMMDDGNIRRYHSISGALEEPRVGRGIKLGIPSYPFQKR